MQVDLETDLNRRRALQRVEELRAQDVSIASVRAEAMVKEVGWLGRPGRHPIPRVAMPLLLYRLALQRLLMLDCGSTLHNSLAQWQSAPFCWGTVLWVLLPAEGSQAPPVLSLCDSANISAIGRISHWTCCQAESLDQATD